MPSHQERIQRNNGCPQCGGNLLDGKHGIGTTFMGMYMIVCPEYPKNGPEVTIITKYGERNELS